MAGKGQPKTGGRKKGTPNKLTQSVQEFIEDVLTHENAVERAKHFVNEANDKTASFVLMRLLEYRFGKPKENLALTGADDGPVQIEVRVVKHAQGAD